LICLLTILFYFTQQIKGRLKLVSGQWFIYQRVYRNVKTCPTRLELEQGVDVRRMCRADVLPMLTKGIPQILHLQNIV
jgi:hypothetical protein